MAVTAIWNITGRIDRALAYAENPDKTINPEHLKNARLTPAESESISKVIAYAVQQKKTSGGGSNPYFVTGVNCGADTAAFEMMKTKERYGKPGGNTAYHAYQSFAPGEATPEAAHEIGVKLASEIWGGRFQVVVATHLDKGHLHNHFILNSVSFKDGKKYNDCRATYKVIRETSDRLCREYGLSVIKGPEAGKTKAYAEWRDEMAGKPTMRSLVKSDVDRAIAESMTDREFFAKLKAMGYMMKQGKDVTIVPPGKERGVRLARNFGDGYTIESIRRRILANDSPAKPQKPLSERKITKRHASSISPPRMRIGGYYGLYVRFQYELTVRHRRAPGRNARMHYLLREDIGKLDKIYSEMTLLRENGIKTAGQLLSYREGIAQKVTSLEEGRRKLYQKLRRKSAAGHEGGIKSEIAEITYGLRMLRQEVKKADSIAERSGVIKQKLEALDSIRKQGQQKEVKEYGHIR